MRSEAEKKSIVKSIKLSPSQVQQIEEKANERNMTFSSYMVDCALHNNQGITPQIAVKYQELVNMVQEIETTLIVMTMSERKNCDGKQMIYVNCFIL